MTNIYLPPSSNLAPSGADGNPLPKVTPRWALLLASIYLIPNL
jgi:hypothetical protein